MDRRQAVNLVKAVPQWRVALSIVLLGMALGSGTALAGGYGAYLESEFSFAKIDDNGVHRDFDAKMGGLGFIWDGNIAVDELLNYRLSFGYRVGRRFLDAHSNETVNGLTFDQTLGMAPFRNSRFRVWGGPSLRFSVDWYSSAGDLDIVDVAIGIGPRIGVNYHLNEKISLTTSLSYHYMYLAENIESNGSNETFDGPQHIVGLRVGILFRGEDDIWDD